MNSISVFLILLICLAFSFMSFPAYSDVCSNDKGKSNNEKSTFCFFSLNNPVEFNKLKEKYKNNDNVEVKEFYGTGNKAQSVQERFKIMMNDSECDHLIVSGHHTGYFAGEQSIDANNPHQTLSLDFMEDMACDSSCGDWFDNVKSLFLMGCQTLKAEEEYTGSNAKTADKETIRITAKANAQFKSQHIEVNQAYSSTLNSNDKLSHRYLRIFPSSSIYGWGRSAPGEKTGSQNSIPNFIDLISQLSEESDEGKASNVNSILNFIEYANDQNKNCSLGVLWSAHIDKNPANVTRPTACYISDNEDLARKHQKQGCDLRNALKSGDESKIQSALDEILKDTDSISANFNRIMSLVISEKDKDSKPNWYESSIAKLKNSDNLKNLLIERSQDINTGFIRKTDYLYAYTELDFHTPDSSKNLAEFFLSQLNNSFDEVSKKLWESKTNRRTGKVPSENVQIAFRGAIFDAISDNNLNWISQSSPEKFNTLQNKFKNSNFEWDQIRGSYMTYLKDTPSEVEIQTADNFLKRSPYYRESWFKQEICNIDQKQHSSICKQN